jgi:hypothetical protein
MATTISNVSSLIFQSDAFWAALGTTIGNNVHALPRLGRMLSLNKSLRSELLEVLAAVVCRKRKRAAIVVVNPQQSTFVTAIRSMLPYDSTRVYMTSMDLPEAGRRFAMSQPTVLALLCATGKDLESDGREAASQHGRLTLPTLIAAAMVQKGGLRRVSTTLASRAKANAKTRAKFTPTVQTAIDTLLKPVLAKVKATARDIKSKAYHLKNLYRVLRTMTRNIRDGAAGTTRKELAASLRDAKETAQRLDPEFNRISKIRATERPADIRDALWRQVAAGCIAAGAAARGAAGGLVSVRVD